MLRSGLIALVLMLPVPAFSAEAGVPVREIMAAATSNWQDLASENDAPPAYVDYFSEDFLKRLYSRDFTAKYREAAKYPAYEDDGSPFAYDPIIGGQDGCALKDLKIGDGVAKGAETDITVTFDNTYCFGESHDPSWKPVTLVFRVIEEDGHAVIDDIDRENTEGTGSLKAEMQELATSGAQDGPQSDDPEGQGKDEAE